MITYTFTLKLKGLQQSSDFMLPLTYEEENEPELVFTAKVKERMRLYLQYKTDCTINQRDLESMVIFWIQDIKEGFRNTVMNLTLPSLIGNKIKHLQDSGNQDLPQLIEPNLTNIEPKGGALPPLNFD